MRGQFSMNTTVAAMMAMVLVAGMRANFLRLKEILSSEFPGQWSGIDGANYPVPEWTKLVMNAVSAMQMFVMVLVLA
eukprot:scaffold96615_cov23-Cyclotella_meneghiniana.AAC.1